MFNLKALTAKWYKPKVGGLFAMERKRMYRENSYQSMNTSNDVVQNRMDNIDNTTFFTDFQNKEFEQNTEERSEILNKLKNPNLVSNKDSDKKEEKLKYYFEQINRVYNDVKDKIPANLTNVITPAFLQSVLINENITKLDQNAGKGVKNVGQGLMQIVRITFRDVIKKQNKHGIKFDDNPNMYDVDTSIKAAIAHFILLYGYVKSAIKDKKRRLFFENDTIEGKQFALATAYYAGQGEYDETKKKFGKDYARAVLYLSMKNPNYTFTTLSTIPEKPTPESSSDLMISSYYEEQTPIVDSYLSNKKKLASLTEIAVTLKENTPNYNQINQDFLEYMEFKENDELIKQKVETLLNIQEKIQNIELKVDSWGELTKESEDKLSPDGLEFNRLIRDLNLSSQDEEKFISSLAELFPSTTVVFLVKPEENLSKDNQDSLNKKITEQIRIAIERGSKLGIHKAEIEIKMVNDKNIDNKEIKGGFLSLFEDKMERIKVEEEPNLSAEEKEAILYNNKDEIKKKEILTQLFADPIYQSLLKAYNLKNNEFDADIDKANLDKHKKDVYALAKIKFLYLIKHASLQTQDLKDYGAEYRSTMESKEEAEKNVSKDTLQTLAEIYLLLHPGSEKRANIEDAVQDINNIEKLIEDLGGKDAVKAEIAKMAKTKDEILVIGGLVEEGKKSTEGLQKLLEQLQKKHAQLPKDEVFLKQSLDCSINLLTETIRRQDNVKFLEQKVKDLEAANNKEIYYNDSIGAESLERSDKPLGNLKNSFKDWHEFYKQPKISARNSEELNKIIQQRASEAGQILDLQEKIANPNQIRTDLEKLDSNRNNLQTNETNQVNLLKISVEQLPETTPERNELINLITDLTNGVNDNKILQIKEKVSKLTGSEGVQLTLQISQLEQINSKKEELEAQIEAKNKLLNLSPDPENPLLNAQEVAHNLYTKYQASLNSPNNQAAFIEADLLNFITGSQSLSQARAELKQEQKWLDCCKCCANNPEHIGSLLKVNDLVDVKYNANQLEAMSKYLGLIDRPGRKAEIEYLKNNGNDKSVQATLDPQMKAMDDSLAKGNKLTDSIVLNQESNKQLQRLLSSGVNFSELPGVLKLALIAGALYFTAKHPKWAFGAVAAVTGGMLITGENTFSGLANKVVDTVKTGLDNASEKIYWQIC